MMFRWLHPAYDEVEKACLAWTLSKEQAREQARIIMRALYDAGCFSEPWRLESGLVVSDSMPRGTAA